MAPSVKRRRKMLGKKTLEERIAASIRAEFGEIVTSLEKDHQEYLRRLRLKEKTRDALEEAEAEAQRLHSERTALEKRLREAHSEESETKSTPLKRATKKVEKALGKARADFEKADFDEAAEGFTLKAKATIAEEEVDRRLGVLEETLEDLLAGVSDEVKEITQVLRQEYKEPRFETPEERNSHKERMNEILKALTKSYAPGK
jgi:hypothetical protein